MLYTEINIKGTDYKLRIDSRACVALEKRLGKSPLDVFISTQNGSLPRLAEVIAILHAALQKYNHGITEDKTYDLYDEYIEEGGTFTDLIPIVLEIFKVSGFFKEDEETDEEKK